VCIDKRSVKAHANKCENMQEAVTTELRQQLQHVALLTNLLLSKHAPRRAGTDQVRNRTCR
jgi:hypothetical protein